MSMRGIEPGSPGPKASVLSTELFRLRTNMGRKSLSVQTAASRDLSLECRFAWKERDVTMYTKRAMRHVFGLTVC